MASTGFVGGAVVGMDASTDSGIYAEAGERGSAVSDAVAAVPAAVVHIVVSHSAVVGSIRESVE